MDGLTVAQLYKICEKAVKEGHGNKTIMISSDDEGNEFHTLYYGLTTDPTAVKELLDMTCSNAENAKATVLLG